MKKYIPNGVIILMFVLCAACAAKKEKDSTANDSTDLIVDSLGSNPPVVKTPLSHAPKDDGKGTYEYINTYLIEKVQDSTQIQTIRISCAIKIEITEAEKNANEQREAEWRASEYRSDSIWNASEHDSASIAEREETQSTIGDDDMWYRYIDQTAQEKLFFLDSLKIRTITAPDNKSYLKLVGTTGKVWIVDIRSRTEPGRTIVFFNKDKDPIILDRLDINTFLIRDYFLSYRGH